MENRKGIQTSEFWVTVVTMVLGAVNEMTGRNIDVPGAAMVWGPPIAYTLARAMAKMGK